MSIERESKLVLNRLMRDNEKSLINEILNFIRCKHCKNLEEECCCPRCAGICENKVFEGCDCDEYCDGCEKKCDELASINICDNDCSHLYNLCEGCAENNDVIKNLGVNECESCGYLYCIECDSYCYNCNIDYADYSEYNRLKEGQIW